MKIFLADDEPIALLRLERAVEAIADTEVAGRAATGDEAITMIRALQPDVALLDIEMPGASGLQIAAALGNAADRPEVIFVTAHDRHAARAFDLSAADYLLKPVGLPRLEVALRRAGERIEARRAAARLLKPDPRSAAKAETEDDADAIWVREPKGLTRIDLNEVDRLEAAGDYVVVHCGDVSHIIRDSIGSLERRLNPNVVQRIHRSMMVNRARVRSIRRIRRRSYALIMENGMLCEVGPSYVAAVMERFGTHRWRDTGL